ncbi:MAG: hypothetical protein DRI95_08315 [Bacteroidetes bacterium]|nr:MAG: hypothetical protein DRI95_08315 [Bacteroidota bacterium]
MEQKKDENVYYELINGLWYSNFFYLEDVENAGKKISSSYMYYLNHDLTVSLCKVDDENESINIGKVEPMIRKSRDKMVVNINKERDVFLKKIEELDKERDVFLKKIEELDNDIDLLNSI